MSRKKKKPAAQKPAQMRWEFDPDIPTHDFLEEGPLDDTWNLQEAVENFVSWVEEGQFLTWEAVVCEEQGLPLTAGQKKALSSLLSFNDEDDDQILYIDEIPRPSEPWYVILNKIVPHLLTEPFNTSDVQEEVQSDGWGRIMCALREYGQELPSPAGTTSVMEVVPAELRHKLWLQYCFNDLAGLGQDEDMTLEDPEEHYRIGVGRAPEAGPLGSKGSPEAGVDGTIQSGFYKTSGVKPGRGKGSVDILSRGRRTRWPDEEGRMVLPDIATSVTRAEGQDRGKWQSRRGLISSV